jgi:mono/diheme cytochrome c family protein
MRGWPTTLGFSFIAAVTVAAAGAASPSARHYAQQITIWDGVYTDAQADRGAKLYAARCAGCHGDALQGVEAAPALTGPTFYGNWDGESLDALFERMRISMPLDRPGSLTRAENTDLLAYMLRVAKYPAGALLLDAQGGALTRIRIVMYRPQP